MFVCFLACYLNEILVTADGVTKLLNDRKEDKATGPDDMPAKFIRIICSYDVAPAQTIMFQRSIKQGKVPDDWRRVKISPLFKMGNRSKAYSHLE